MLVKIILVPLPFSLARDYEGRLVARNTDLVRIKRVYNNKKIEYSFLDKPEEIVFGSFEAGFYLPVAWAFRSEDSDHYHISQKDLPDIVSKNFIAKDRYGRFITEGEARYRVPRLQMYLDERQVAHLRYPF